MTGRIIKGVGGFYTVSSNGEEHICRAPGKFRREKLTPLVGDYVDFIPQTSREDGREEDGVIESIHQRTNVCLRPPVANVDQLAIVIAPMPEPDLLLVDRLMAYASIEGMRILLCVNKRDMGEALYESISTEYKSSGAEICAVSASAGTNIPRLEEKLSGYTTCFAGQSGTGKSSLLNALMPDLLLPTGKISSRTAHGKHTTRHASLIELDGEGFVVDTPGFSLLEMPLMDPVSLKEYYPDFSPYEGQCRYSVCMHLREPDCAVSKAVESGALSENRILRYGVLYEELREKWKNKYS